MSYPMVHLEAAYRLLEKLEWIENKGDFILGAVAPDSVHFRSERHVPQREKGESKSRRHVPQQKTAKTKTATGSTGTVFVSYEGGDSELFNYLKYILQAKCVANVSGL